MCEYCNPNYYPANLDGNNEFDARIYKLGNYSIGIPEYYLLNIILDINVGTPNFQEYETNIEINYCPICGRKLLEEEE